MHALREHHEPRLWTSIPRSIRTAASPGYPIPKAIRSNSGNPAVTIEAEVGDNQIGSDSVYYVASRHIARRHMTAKRDPQTLLPLTPAMFYVLVALADRPSHGYAILKEVEQLTDGAVRLSTGTLYGIIKRLLADGLIREDAGRTADARRRSYDLTAFGRGVARAEAARLEQTLAIARRKTLFRRA